MTDRITIDDLALNSCRIGKDCWDREKPQNFLLNCDIYLDLSAAAQFDNLSKSVNYGTLSKSILKQVSSIAKTEDEITFLERLSVHILHELKEVSKCRLSLENTKAILFGKGVSCSLELKRQAEEFGVSQVVVSQVETNVIIGINPWERKQKQKILFDLIFESVKPSISPLVEQVKSLLECLEKTSFRTLEAFSQQIMDFCSNRFIKETKVTVVVSKPNASSTYRCASIEMTRSFTPKSAPYVFLAFGSNLGDRFENISRGLSLLEVKGAGDVIETSFMYETEPMYRSDQPKFLNCVAKIQKTLTPQDLHQITKIIETEVGRIPTFRDGPRVLDIDILFYGHEILDTEDLTIPHPRISERLFVLAPLCDIEPNFLHPKLMLTIEQLFRRVTAESVISKYQSIRKISRIGDRLINWGERTFSMAILNITPDSFSNDNEFFFNGHLTTENQKSLKYLVNELESSDYDIIDIGGCSTRPGADYITEDEELSRVISVISYLKKDLRTNLIISIDTFRSSVAYEAVQAGADMVNDVSGLRHDPNMAKMVAQLNIPICITHSRGNSKTMSDLNDYSEYQIPLGYPGLEIIRGVAVELSRQVQTAIDSSIARWNIIIDPGIGFGKSGEQNLRLLANLNDLFQQEIDGAPVIQRYPLLIGPSRKKFIGDITGKLDPKERDFGTAATLTAGVSQGVDIARFHHSKDIMDALKVANAIYNDMNQANKHQI